MTDRNTRFLFLLDGFDELLMSRGLTNQLKQLLDQVASFQQRYDGSSSGKHHRVLLTGRPLALYGIERDMPRNLAWVAISPMGDKVQQQWFEKWEQVVDRDLTSPPAPLLQGEGSKIPPFPGREGGLGGLGHRQKLEAFLQDERCPKQVQELAREPLLLYLLAAMSRDGQRKMKLAKFYSKRGNSLMKAN